MAHEFPPPYPVQFTGSPLARWVLAHLGWRVKFEGLPALQGMIVVYPHTRNWGFPVCVLVKWAIGIQLNFWGKNSLFRIPLFGPWLRWLGGVPVDRSASKGMVALEFVTLSGAPVADLARIAASYEGVQDFIPQKAAPIRLLDRADDLRAKKMKAVKA